MRTTGPVESHSAWPTGHERRRQLLRRVVVVVGLLTLAWELAVALVPLEGSSFVALDPPNLVLVGVVLAATLSAARASPTDSRRAWYVLAAVIATGLIGDLIFSVLDVAGVVPSVSIADVVYLAGYPFLLVALWWVARCRGGNAGVQATYDGLLLAAGLLLLVWELLTLSLGVEGMGTDLDITILVAYPFLDLLLLGAAAGVVMSSRRVEPTVAWICGYLVVVIVGDSLYLVASVRAESLYAWSTVLYVVAFSCLGLAATSPSAPAIASPSADPARIGRTRYLLLGASMAAPAVTAGIVLASDGDVSVPVLLGSTLVIAVLVSWRVADAVRSERDARLASERAHFELWEQSRHDPLTGLGNRLALLEDVRLAEGDLVVLFLDLDRFKQVNDTSGHAAGDEVLCEVTSRLRAALDPGERVYRLSGDEFVVVRPVVPPVAGRVRAEPTTSRAAAVDDPATALLEGVEDRAAEFVEILGRPYFPSGMEWHLTASVGCALSLEASRTTEHPESVLQRADIAMYRAKRDRTGAVRVFDREMQRALDDAHEAEIDLRRAVATSGFVPAVQPVVDLHAGTIVGFEALARWRRGTEVVAAAAFIEVAERAGLLPEIQAQVFDKALAFLHTWQRSAPERRGAYMALNASATELVAPGYVESLLGRLSEARLGPETVVVELTEGALVAAPEVVASRLNHLRRLGFRIALDDFGTGFSSLSHLLDFSVDVVKIDRTFVGELTPELGPNSVVAATYRLAETLGLDVIAEGVETPEQLDLLRRIGVTRAQGYLLARPVLAEDALALPSRLDLPSHAPVD